MLELVCVFLSISSLDPRGVLETDTLVSSENLIPFNIILLS